MEGSSATLSDLHQILNTAPFTADGRSYLIHDLSGSAQGIPTLCAQIPKFLLLKWYRLKKSGSTEQYVALANNSIIAYAVTLWATDRLEFECCEAQYD